MEIKSITPEIRCDINNFIKEHWYSTDMAVRGELVDMTKLNGFVYYEDHDNIMGILTYRIYNRECEIMSLDSLRENNGIGTSLILRLKDEAKKLNSIKIKLITTNDNINAIKFYQRRGFDMVHLYFNAVSESRKLKPSIPLLGDYDIPIKHEIEFEMNIN